MLYYFIWGLNYELQWIDYRRKKFTRNNLINSCIMADIKSQTYKNVNHVVLINSNGRVIHDPNPNQRCINKNIIKTDQIVGWYQIQKIRKKI